MQKQPVLFVKSKMIRLAPISTYPNIADILTTSMQSAGPQFCMHRNYILAKSDTINLRVNEMVASVSGASIRRSSRLLTTKQETIFALEECGD